MTRIGTGISGFSGSGWDSGLFALFLNGKIKNGISESFLYTYINKKTHNHTPYLSTSLFLSLTSIPFFRFLFQPITARIFTGIFCFPVWFRFRFWRCTMLDHQKSWAAHTKPTKKRKTQAPEKAIRKAIQQAFKLRHRITLHETDAGGMSDKKGVMRCPKDLAAALGLPQALPFGLEAWLGLPPGFPDLTGCLGGRLVFIEVKRPGGSFRPGQKEFLEAARLAGHVAFWADSVDSALAQFESEVAA
jgi:hypothetical protein